MTFLHAVIESVAHYLHMGGNNVAKKNHRLSLHIIQHVVELLVLWQIPYLFIMTKRSTRTFALFTKGVQVRSTRSH